MIAIKKSTTIPAVLGSTKVEKQRRSLEATVRSGGHLSSDDFNSYWQDNELRDTLWKQQHMKCCYCELRRDRRREMDVDHFRPKAKVEEDKTHMGYWWLAYEWQNLLYSCKYCNQEHKKNFFPLLENGIRARLPEDELTLERPALLNPYVDDVERCFGYEWVHSAHHMVEVTGVDCEIAKDEEGPRYRSLV